MMSCHDIGHGLNEVTRRVLVEYDAGLIPYEPTFRILHQCAKSVHWCDGNEYEATACMYDRCGRCLRKDLPMFGLRVPFDKAEAARKLLDGKILDYHLCQDCIDELGAQEFVHEPWDVEKESHYDYFG